MRKDNRDFRNVYGLKRLSLAVDRLTIQDKKNADQAKKWIKAWSKVANLKP